MGQSNSSYKDIYTSIGQKILSSLHISKKPCKVLPEIGSDAVSLILQYLEPNEIAKCRCVSSRWRDDTNKAVSWKCCSIIADIDSGIYPQNPASIIHCRDLQLLPPSLKTMDTLNQKEKKTFSKRVKWMIHFEHLLTSGVFLHLHTLSLYCEVVPPCMWRALLEISELQNLLLSTSATYAKLFENESLTALQTLLERGKLTSLRFEGIFPASIAIKAVTDSLLKSNLHTLEYSSLSLEEEITYNENFTLINELLHQISISPTLKILRLTVINSTFKIENIGGVQNITLLTHPSWNIVGFTELKHLSITTDDAYFNTGDSKKLSLLSWLACSKLETLSLTLLCGSRNLQFCSDLFKKISEVPSLHTISFTLINIYDNYYHIYTVYEILMAVGVCKALTLLQLKYVKNHSDMQDTSTHVSTYINLIKKLNKILLVNPDLCIKLDLSFTDPLKDEDMPYLNSRACISHIKESNINYIYI